MQTITTTPKDPNRKAFHEFTREELAPKLETAGTTYEIAEALLTLDRTAAMDLRLNKQYDMWLDMANVLCGLSAQKIELKTNSLRFIWPGANSKARSERGIPEPKICSILLPKNG